MVFGLRVFRSVPASVLYLKNRMASTKPTILSPNISISPATSITIKKGKQTWLVDSPNDRPLILLCEYMNAKKKHIDKFVDFYKEKNYDVLTVNLKPWQLFFPERGSQVLAREIANFLLANERFFPIVYHGFSVGGYLWGEVLNHCCNQSPKYESFTNRIRGQVVDSGVDVSEIPTAFPAAVFPEKPFLRNTFEKFIRYQMKTFYNESTRHYISARAAFTKGLVQGPTLLIYSDSDPLSTARINGAIVNELKELNLPCQEKEFKGTKHVMHYQGHKEEYMSILSQFLSEIDSTPVANRDLLSYADKELHLKSRL